MDLFLLARKLLFGSSLRLHPLPGKLQGWVSRISR